MCTSKAQDARAAHRVGSQFERRHGVVAFAVAGSQSWDLGQKPLDPKPTQEYPRLVNVGSLMQFRVSSAIAIAVESTSQQNTERLGHGMDVHTDYEQRQQTQT